MNKYEHIEYTPYGEYWIENSHAAGILKSLFFTSFAEQNSVSNRKVASFTGKERDEARTIAGVLCVGLYYYGARYLDPRTSRWLSTDPALGEYIPMAPVNDEAKKHNQNLPGMGGIYNTVNFHLYHYAGNNPIRYTDPTGREDSIPEISIIREPNNSAEFYVTLFPEENRTFIENNQTKTTKLLWIDAQADDTSLNVSLGATSLYSELNTPVTVGVLGELLTATLNIDFTDDGMTYGAQGSLFSLMGKIGARFNLGGRNLSFFASGACGLTAGFEFSFKASEGIIIDAGIIIKPRIEIGWKKND